jgi:AraC-like DNA-binding protein
MCHIENFLQNQTSCLIGHLSKTQIQLLEGEMNNFTIYNTQQENNDPCIEKLLCTNILKHASELSINPSQHLPAWLIQLLNTFQNTSQLKYDLPTLLKNCYFSKPYICKVFKKYMGVTMTDYLLQARLTYASSLLKYTDMSITDIVSEIGIISIPYFNKTFKEMFNTTPSNYRKTNK